MTRRRAMMVHLVAAAVMLPSLAWAREGSAPVAQGGAATTAAPSSSEPGGIAAPFATRAIAEDSLRSVAGREDTTQVAQAEQVAGVSRNSVGDNSLTGDARIDGNAFQNMSGLSILNVNTGNNVAINAAMNVNISLGGGTP